MGLWSVVGTFYYLTTLVVFACNSSFVALPFIIVYSFQVQIYPGRFFWTAWNFMAPRRSWYHHRLLTSHDP
jgi:hypothetical protein